jgi:hypothetical protein
MPRGYPKDKDPEAVPDLPRKRGRKTGAEKMDEVTEAEYGIPPPDEIDDKDTDATGAPKRKYKKRKKDAKATPVRPELVAMAADGALIISAQVYGMFRAPRQLEYDPGQRLEFTKLLGEWAESEGMELPLWVQVCIAGGVCVGTAIARAETGGGRPSPEARPLRVVSQFDAAQVPATSPLRPTPVDSHRGNEGVGQDVVPAALATEQGTPSPSP